MRQQTTEEAWEFSEVERDARLCALYFGRGGALRARRLIGASRDERRKDGGWGGEGSGRGQGVGMQSPRLHA